MKKKKKRKNRLTYGLVKKDVAKTGAIAVGFSQTSYEYHIGGFLFSTSSVVHGNLHFTDEQYNDAYSKANNIVNKKKKESVDGK